MKINLPLACLVVVLPFVVRAASAPAAPNGQPAQKLFAVTIATGPAWDATKSANDQKFFKEHSANLARMRTEGVLVLGGRYTDKGFLVVRAPDEASVRAQLAQDPSITAGTFQAAVDEYRPFYHGDTRPPTVSPAERPAASPTPAPSAPQKHFLIVLRVVPRLQDEKSWTDADKATVGQHFKRLQEAVTRGQVLLAGRTEESLDRTFGLVVFSATDEAAAREFMNGDPCVVAGVMTATLHPYGLALRAK